MFMDVLLDLVRDHFISRYDYMLFEILKVGLLALIYLHLLFFGRD
ncbi:hypothetical protein [Dipodfec virus RodF1_24]|uniref:Uncharacterized protein n=1 Tax=Dipodfec virus RodF1_24 TaxID=2929294 RepID=A0A976N3E3_9VIRU|nr:hypothetical protein [Dipodfec virus RodF1_24]